jgi:hypothetical protein
MSEWIRIQPRAFGTFAVQPRHCTSSNFNNTNDFLTSRSSRLRKGKKEYACTDFPSFSIVVSDTSWLNQCCSGRVLHIALVRHYPIRLAQPSISYHTSSSSIVRIQYNHPSLVCSNELAERFPSIYIACNSTQSMTLFITDHFRLFYPYYYNHILTLLS